MGCCAQDRDQSIAARWLPKAFGGLLMVIGALILLSDWFDTGINGKLRWEKTEIVERRSADFGEPSPKGNAERLLRYRITQGETAVLTLTVAEYLDVQHQKARAIVFPPGQAEHSDGRLRHDLWQQAADAINTHTTRDAVFISWWDNAQRIDYATQRPVWALQPSALAFHDRYELGLWSELTGSVTKEDGKLRQLAHWLTTDSELAIAEMQMLFKQQPTYILICLDDLARLGEIETLSGKKLPFEFKLFPPANDLHGQIAAVKTWAAENGTGNYLAQQLGSGETRAWRITTGQGTQTLLARLLPFTSSLAKPIDQLALVYQSAWGAYLSIYQLKPRSH
jgi:hydroxylamine oxidation protein HaoB